MPFSDTIFINTNSISLIILCKSVMVGMRNKDKGVRENQ